MHRDLHNVKLYTGAGRGAGPRLRGSAGVFTLKDKYLPLRVRLRMCGSVCVGLRTPLYKVCSRLSWTPGLNGIRFGSVGEMGVGEGLRADPKTRFRVTPSPSEVLKDKFGTGQRTPPRPYPLLWTKIV